MRAESAPKAPACPLRDHQPSAQRCRVPGRPTHLPQGLPFAVVGVGDLLALFRCVSVRYRFSTDITRPSLMGAIGRVFSTMEVRMVSATDTDQYSLSSAVQARAAQASSRGAAELESPNHAVT